MRDDVDFDTMIERSKRKWQLVELCSPVKVWVAHQRRKRIKDQWSVCRGQAPREVMRQRELLAILQREAMMLLKGDKQ